MIALVANDSGSKKEMQDDSSNSKPGKDGEIVNEVWD